MQHNTESRMQILGTDPSFTVRDDGIYQYKTLAKVENTNITWQNNKKAFRAFKQTIGIKMKLL